MTTASASIQKWKKELTLTWLALLGLTLLGPSLAQGAAGAKGTIGALVLVIAGLKFLAIGWSFMELRFAHRAWAFITPLLGVLVLLICFLRFSA